MSMRRALRAFGVVEYLWRVRWPDSAARPRRVASPAAGQSAADGRASRSPRRRHCTCRATAWSPGPIPRSAHWASTGRRGVRLCPRQGDIRRADGPGGRRRDEGMEDQHCPDPAERGSWLGTGNLPPTAPSAAAYQQAVKTYADLLVDNGINVILDLHWTWASTPAPAEAARTSRPPVRSRCRTRATPPRSGPGGPRCSRGTERSSSTCSTSRTRTRPTTGSTPRPHGPVCVTAAPAPGSPIRRRHADPRQRGTATGATNVIMSGGLEWTNNLSRWLEFKPADPTGNLMASWHSYNFNGCVTTSCWDSNIGAVAAQVPVQAGEIVRTPAPMTTSTR